MATSTPLEENLRDTRHKGVRRHVPRTCRTHADRTSGREKSNDVAARSATFEPLGLRTYTPSLAVIAQSEGCYHWTPEGRKLADFTSGVLVANLGHNPARWWRRVLGYMGLATAAEELSSSLPPEEGR